MKSLLHRLTLAGALVALAAAPALAQSPTPEGTVITSTATATWTDANGNSYDPVTASVSVTVAFLAGPDASSPATVSPASPSTGNDIAFTITNAGNGVDQFSVAFTSAAGLTISGYRVGATTYATLAELNAALAGTDVPAASSVTVVAVYTVAPGQGGQTLPVTMTATSVRTPAASDASTTNVIPVVTAGVNVTPDGATVQRLPSNGTSYTQVFTVSNTGNASDTYTLVAQSNGTAVAIVSTEGTGVSGGQVTIASGGSVGITVTYTVSAVAAGTTDVVRLTATSGTSPAVSDDGSLTVTVIRAAVAMTKQAFRDNQTTPINDTTDRVLPSEFLQYRITVTNTGAAAASTVEISDVLPAQVVYVSSAGDAAGWTIAETSGTVTASLSGTLAAGASRHIWIRVQVR
jgi:trimeric autotransporter adhesin